MALKRSPRRSRSDMPLMAHLRELRTRLIVCVIGVFAGSIVGFALWDPILDLATGPYCRAQAERGVEAFNGQSACQLYISSPLALLTTRLSVSGYVGIFLALPIILWNLWRFVTPGLSGKERRYAIPFVISSVLLFTLGALTAWWTIPKAMEFFLAIGGENIATIFDPGPYLRMIFVMMLVFGVAFEIPLLLVFLQLAGVVQSKTLSRYRRHAIVVNFIIAAVGTPGQDPYSLIMLAIPMCVLYEVAIIIGKIAKK